MRVRLALLAAAVILAGFRHADAHPHVWIKTESVLVYGADGRLSAIRHGWTFDEAYSAYAVQGFPRGADGKLDAEKMAELAKINIESLAESGFFTVAKSSGAKLGLGEPTRYGTAFDNGRLTLSFDLPVVASGKADKTVVLEVYDPTFFVEFSLADGAEPVRLEGAPSGCALSVTRPKPAEPAKPGGLGEAFFSALGAASQYGARFSSRALVACP